MPHAVTKKVTTISALAGTRMSEDWLYYNQEVSRLHGNNKWFRLLSMIPAEMVIGHDIDSIRIRFAIFNERSLDMETKKAFFRYIYSKAIQGWDDEVEHEQLHFFDDPELFRWANEVQWTKMTFVESICEQHDNDAYKQWLADCKRQWEAERKRQRRATIRKREFLASPLYQFIKQLIYTEDEIITSATLYQAYTKFCKTNILQAESQKSFGRTLSDYGITPFKNKNTRSYRLTKECVDGFIHYYHIPEIDLQEVKEAKEAYRQSLMKMDKMAAYILNMASDSDN